MKRDKKAEEEIAALALEIMKACKVNTNIAYNLAIWIYKREHPGFNEDVSV